MKREFDDHDVVKVSDQLPEEAPPEQVPDDVPEASEGAARESARAHLRRVARPDGSERARGENSGRS
jgi:hypothetical protein